MRIGNIILSLFKNINNVVKYSLNNYRIYTGCTLKLFPQKFVFVKTLLKSPKN